MIKGEVRMGENVIVELNKALETSFIDRARESNLALRPQLISNDCREGKKLLCSLIDELNVCSSFFISVAFITMSGLTPLLEVFKELERKGIPGRILTTDYLLFSEPKALRKLAAYDNIELRMYGTEGSNEGFHTKGYVFQHREVYKIIVGSANLTARALTVNKEWNAKIVSMAEGEYIHTVKEEFEKLWRSGKSLSFDQFIDRYELRYQFDQEQKRIVKSNPIISIPDYKLQSNSMQVEFMLSLKKLVDKGENKALLVSATGTGKTFASAFAIRDLNPKKVLFVVHREQIARQAMESYKRVFNHRIPMGLLSGSVKDWQAAFLFSTVQTVSKEDSLVRFSKDEFDIIVIDEVHRAGADSYQSIFDYFQPRLWLGMTASPYRLDGVDIFAMFDHNIAHEISLQDALEEDLLCPFHYFGISDFEIADEGTRLLQSADGAGRYAVSDGNRSKSPNYRLFSRIDHEKRVDYIIQQAEYYGFSGNRVKGLAFCSGKEEAFSLSTLFNSRGYRTVALTGDDSMERRFEYIERLVTGDRYDYLDYIFTVDIFNEGVDIPEVNQILLLRPTESPTIFIQQLGRGLRKFRGKEYTVIIDFIGNYQQNYMIPIALFGDRSYNKDNLRRKVIEATRTIPGCSSVSFDEISKQRIFESVDQANFSQIRLIKDNYLQLKQKLGRIPAMMDFEKHGLMDLQCLFDHPSLGSYYEFLKRYEKEYTVHFTDSQELFLRFISIRFANGKRVHELLLIKTLLGEGKVDFAQLAGEIRSSYHLPFTENTKNQLVNIFTGDFLSGSSKKTFAQCIFIEPDGDGYRISKVFADLLKDRDFFGQVKEVIEYSMEKYERQYSTGYKDTGFQLYAKYTYSDVCRILEWEKDEVPLNIGGYKYDKRTNTYPVFINYHKEEDIADTIKYEDRFTGNASLIALSKSNRSRESDDVQYALRSQELGIQMHLFVRKNKDDKTSKEFYYLGRIRPTGKTKEITMPDNKSKAVEIFYDLETRIRDDLYDYIIR